MHAAPRRPAVSWPAALLPGALALALLTAGTMSATAGGSDVGAPAGDRQVTELQVVDAAE